jgi:peptidyl-Lys metalloendopeptidase
MSPLLALLAVLAAPAAPLTCRLDAVPPTTVRFTLTNPSPAPLWVLRWNTPLEERWKGTIFTVTSGMKEIPYQGPMTKRGDPGREEYVEIPAGGSVSGEADLAQVYEMKKPGKYVVQVTGELADVVKDGAEVPRGRDRFAGLTVECAAVPLTP